CAQGYSLSNIESAARGLGVLLELSRPGPGPRTILISSTDLAERYGFLVHTWWHIKNQLLCAGHIVASSNGQSFSSRLGRHKHKKTYCVSPSTFGQYLKALDE